MKSKNEKLLKLFSYSAYLFIYSKEEKGKNFNQPLTNQVMYQNVKNREWEKKRERKRERKKQGILREGEMKMERGNSSFFSNSKAFSLKLEDRQGGAEK